MVLFVADLAVLKAELRLSGVTGANNNAENIIERAILRARLNLYERLGSSLISDLLAISYTAAPTTDDQRRRALANLVEIEMVKCILLRELPTLFLDSSAVLREDWNTNAAFRSQGQQPCDSQFIEEAIAELTGDNTDSNLKTFTTAVGQPPILQPRLRSDLIRRNRCP